MINVGIIGATGYAGQQLVWILKNHPQVDIIFLTSHNYADSHFHEVYNNYYGFIEDVCLSLENAESKFSLIDVLFVALPSGKSSNIVQKALKLGIKVIDLGSDFRLNSSEGYKNWYEFEHKCPALLEKAVYGLVELNREKIKKSSLIANPGCYPTATLLALAPMIKSELINLDSIIIDAKSGVSGAGRNANIDNLFTECNESIKSYGIGEHRHTPEIEQELSKINGEDIKISFTPHIVPMNRGILVTCYANLIENSSTEELKKIYREFYKGEYFIKVIDDLPQTRWVRGSNLCHIGLKVDLRVKRVIIVAVIDNLIKGAAGQAVQNMNTIFNLNENAGLEFISMAP